MREWEDIMDNNEPNIKVTEYHAVMKTSIGRSTCMKFYMTESEKSNITKTSQLLRWLQEKVAIYGDPVIKELTFKDGECTVIGEGGETNVIFK
jgi:hypothetical protein